MSKTAIIFGASAGLGRALSEELAKKGFSMLLVARGERDLETQCQHLENLYGVKAVYKSLDLSKENDSINVTMDFAHQKLGSLERVFLIAGANSDQDELPSNSETIDFLTRVNGITPAKVMDHVAKNFEKMQTRSVTLCSTVAVTAPRRRNTIYAASKAYAEFFAQGLQHFFSAGQVKVQIIRLGYLKTNLSFGQSLLFPKATPENTAKYLIKKMDSNCGIIYYPKFWFLITTILKMIPNFIFKRMKF